MWCGKSLLYMEKIVAWSVFSAYKRCLGAWWHPPDSLQDTRMDDRAGAELRVGYDAESDIIWLISSFCCHHHSITHCYTVGQKKWLYRYESEKNKSLNVVVFLPVAHNHSRRELRDGVFIHSLYIYMKAQQRTHGYWKRYSVLEEAIANNSTTMNCRIMVTRGI